MTLLVVGPAFLEEALQLGRRRGELLPVGFSGGGQVTRGGPIALEAGAFQAPALIPHRIAYGDVALPRPGYLEALGLESPHDVFPTLQLAGGHAMFYEPAQELTRILLLEPWSQTLVMLVGWKLHRPSTGRVTRCVQAIAVVDGVLEGVEVMFPPRRVQGEALAAVEIQPRDYDMHLLPTLVSVPYPERVDLVLFKTSKGKALEVAQDLLPLGRCELLGVVLREAQDGMVVFVLVGVLVDQPVGDLRLAAQHLGLGCPFLLRQVLDDAGTATSTGGGELHHGHGRPTFDPVARAAGPADRARYVAPAGPRWRSYRS